MTDDPKPRLALYYRLRSGLPAMVWPSPEGDEAIIQIGRSRPYVTTAPNLDFFLQTADTINERDWHNALATGLWPDQTSSWEKPNAE